jgi:hypothetical protein
MNTHGELVFTWKKSVLYVEVFGAFNMEGIKDGAIKYMKTVMDRKVPSFSIIEIWDVETLTSLESMNDVDKLWSNLNKNGCISLALVIPRDVQEWSAKRMLPDIGKIFNNKHDAEQWIKEN